MKKHAENHNFFGFEQRLADALDADCLIPPGSKVLVGVSGGADSVALLHALHVLTKRGLEVKLTVAHLDHSLRDESSADAVFVAELATRLGLGCIVQRRDVAAVASQLGEGLEHAAREVRFDFFRESARQCGARVVVVAHHADDNVETILFRILRGTALRGLAGMPTSRELQPGLEIIRPLLGFRRTEIIEYCRGRNLDWREDHTNAETAHSRNFIRNELLPMIRDRINPQTDEALLRLGSLARQAEELLTAQARRALDDSVIHAQPGRVLIDVKMISAVEPFVRTTAYRLVLQDLGAPQRSLSAEHLVAIDALLDSPAGAVNLPGRFSARRQRSHLLIASKVE